MKQSIKHTHTHPLQLFSLFLRDEHLEAINLVLKITSVGISINLNSSDLGFSQETSPNELSIAIC